MNVMFVDPKWNYELGYNLGLAYVLTAVEKKHAVSLLDMTFQSGFQEKYIVKKVKKETPDIVGISVVTGANYVHTLRIAQAIKRLNSDILIVLGGVLPTLYPDLIIHEPLIDALCIGEGEVTFVEYVDKIENKEPPLVKGIWYKEKDGTVIKNELRPLINNLDDIAFPNWDYWDMDKHVKASRFMSGALACGASRACPYDCSFCFEPVLRKAVPGKSYRTRSAENIIREIEFNVNKYGKYGISHIDFYDSILGFDRQQLEKFCALFVKHGLDKKLTWAGVTRVEMITEEWARCVAQANCVRLAIGVESIDDVVRNKIYNKNITLEQIENAFHLLDKNNIMASCYLMVNAMYDTEETMNKSIAFLRKFNPETSRFTLCLPLPHSKLADEMLDTEKWLTSTIDLKECFRSYSPMFGAVKRMKTIWRLKFISMRICDGIRLRGVVFLWDIIKYLLSINNARVIPLFKRFTLNILMHKTIYAYMREERARRRSQTT